jgi:hypothetical protein
MAEDHIPGRISTQQVPVNGPEGEYLQIELALTKCTCGRIHTAATDSATSGYGSATFQLGILFAQLNDWTRAREVEDNVANG